MAMEGRKNEVRRLTREDAPAVRALYAAGGRDGAWCGGEAVDAVFTQGVWAGAFAGGRLCFCAARVPADAPVAQVGSMLRAYAPGDAPGELLLPPALDRAALGGGERASWESENDAAARVISPVLRLLCPDADGAGEKNPRLLAAIPMIGGMPLLAGYCAAGFAAVCARPLCSLRPHYLLRPRAACGVDESACPVCLPLADTLPLTRMLERGWRLTAVGPLPSDPRPFGFLLIESGFGR